MKEPAYRFADEREWMDTFQVLPFWRTTEGIHPSDEDQPHDNSQRFRRRPRWLSADPATLFARLEVRLSRRIAAARVATRFDVVLPMNARLPLTRT